MPAASFKGGTKLQSAKVLHFAVSCYSQDWRSRRKAQAHTDSHFCLVVFPLWVMNSTEFCRSNTLIHQISEDWEIIRIVSWKHSEVGITENHCVSVCLCSRFVCGPIHHPFSLSTTFCHFLISLCTVFSLYFLLHHLFLPCTVDVIYVEYHYLNIYCRSKLNNA